MTESETFIFEAKKFREDFDLRKTTFKSAMEYLRKHNNIVWRDRTIKMHVPKELQELVEAQCKLEGLI